MNKNYKGLANTTFQLILHVYLYSLIKKRHPCQNIYTQESM